MGNTDVNGLIIITLFKPQTPTDEINGKLTGGIITSKNLGSTGKQFSDLVDLLDAGEAYVNLHTLTNPGGEIGEQYREDKLTRKPTTIKKSDFNSARLGANIS